MTTPNTALVIGRFQIPHFGHWTPLRRALDSAPNVLVLIGSAFHARDPRNPFSWAERRDQLLTMIPDADRARVSFAPVRDYYDDERWRTAVRKIVAAHTPQANEVALVGFRKDHTSAYLDEFPGYGFIPVSPEVDIGSTDLRKVYFEAHETDTALSVMRPYISEGVLEYLRGWAHLPAYRDMVIQHQAVAAYRKKWTNDFYLTGDGVVTCNNHLLLVLRGPEEPGEVCIGDGLWALPGGFVGKYERIFDAVLREIKEETQFNPLRERMLQALRGQAVFDHVLRSLRGRLVTTAYHFELGSDRRPEVHGSSDAKEARWFHFDELPAIEDKLFEDHSCIIGDFVPTVFQH